MSRRTSPFSGGPEGRAEHRVSPSCPALLAAAKRVVLAGLVLLFPPTSRGDDFTPVNVSRRWVFPKDHGRHDGFRLEWWYLTGNVTDSTGHRLGYQLTFFRSALSPKPADRKSPWGTSDFYLAHAAVTDVDGKQFAFKDRFERGRAGLAESSDQTADVSLLDWSLKFTGDRWTLKALDEKLAIDLTCDGGKGPVLQGDGGVNRKGTGDGQASYYYSVTRLKTAGKLTINGKTFDVTGRSWMDHEFSSNAMGEHQVGWDWVGLQLDDGTDLMVYRLRDDAGKTDYLSGTAIDAAGKPTYLTDKQIKLAPDEPWTSPTGGVYPQRWTVDLPGRKLVVKSDLPGQELVTAGQTSVTYFEGSSTVFNGDRIAGRGYLEMTGYVRTTDPRVR